MKVEAKQFTIRAAAPADAPAIARLAGQLGYAATPEEISRRLAEERDDPRHALLVAESGGAVIAWMGLAEERSFLHEPRVEIHGLVVDEAHRSAAIGAKLVERAEQWARERGCRTMLVRSNVIRDRAHRFYERLGYAAVKSQKIFSKHL
jgi:GNAT superfamily N-acetyltransferase